MQCATAAAFLLGLLAVGSAHVQKHSRIDPKLDPESHETFFGHDNPDDGRPSAKNLHFGHPYPEIQDDHKYDDDYVMDKNDDGGYWKLQMAYDEARSKLGKEKDELAKAEAKEKEEKEELDKAKAEEAEKAAAANQVKGKGQDAAKKDRDAGESKEATEDDVAKATADVEKEVADLEECKQQLAEAKKKLEAVLAKKQEADGKKEAAAAENQAVQEEVNTAAQSEAQLEKKVEEEETEHQAAVSAVAKEKSEVKKLEDDMKSSAEKLSHFRKADKDGGVYSVKGNAHATLPALLATIAVVVSVF